MGVVEVCERDGSGGVVEVCERDGMGVVRGMEVCERGWEWWRCVRGMGVMEVCTYS